MRPSSAGIGHVDVADADAGGADEEEGPVTYSNAQDRLIMERVGALVGALGEDEYLTTTLPSEIASIVYVARNLHSMVRTVR